MAAPGAPFEPARAAAQVPAAAAELSMLLSPHAGALESVRRRRTQKCAARADFRRAAQHLSEVEAVADGMLARLDELTATLGTVRGRALLPPTARLRGVLAGERRRHLAAGDAGAGVQLHHRRPGA